MRRLLATVATTVVAALTAVTLSAAPASAAALQEVTGFGPNPSNIKMFLYVPANLAANPPVVVGVHWCHGTGPDFYNVGLKKPVSHYIKSNIEITTSGMCSAEPLNCAIAALGHDRIMFSADYPFEKAEEAGHWLDSEKLDDRVRADIAYNNAVRLLKL